jgi:hypothetical protein
MKFTLTMFFVALSSAVFAKDVALILDDASQRELVAILNAARGAPDLNIVTPISHILEKLKTAPTIETRKDDDSEQKELPQ